MQHVSRPLIASMTSEQCTREEAFLSQLRTAESETVINILNQELTPGGLNTVIENASGFAEAMTHKFRHPDTPPVACKEGCSWCCYQSVSVTAPEIFRITRFITIMHQETDRINLIDRLYKLNEKIHGLPPKARAKKRLPCAFLEGNRCVIYSVRPLACAEFTSFNVQDCKKGQRVGFNPESIIHEKARMLVYGTILNGLINGLRRSLPKSDNTPLELIAAVVCALSENEAEMSWISGSQLFADAHLTGEKI